MAVFHPGEDEVVEQVGTDITGQRTCDDPRRKAQHHRKCALHAPAAVGWQGDDDGKDKHGDDVDQQSGQHDIFGNLLSIEFHCQIPYNIGKWKNDHTPVHGDAKKVP